MRSAGAVVALTVEPVPQLMSIGGRTCVFVSTMSVQVSIETRKRAQILDPGVTGGSKMS